MRNLRLLTSALLASGLMLAACGSDDDTTASSDNGSESASGINVSGEFGEKPTLEVPDGEPAGELEVTTVTEGDGREIGADDYVLAHYLGQAWDERNPDDLDPQALAGLDDEQAEAESVPYVFDNSYDRGSAAGFSLNRVIAGWKDGLTGQKVGSRVLLSIPPESGYGGQEGHDLADDTLIFVVDVVDSIAPDAAATGEAVDGLSDDLPEVEGGETGAPTLNFEGASEPQESDSTVILRGDGDEILDSVIVQMLEAPYPDGEGAQSTWELGTPEEVTIDMLATLPGWDDVADGLTVGSRILTRISAEDAAMPGVEDEEPEGTALVLIVDVLGTY
ncbi:FKBP-type peptidyl-prolyl cis-trans isomerase [Phytoactinopolyspora limicola]|uniref:FKBP-type peptidyl-prolyl cis-trans isomerase n=1 Tax=Phytoactinopolyspora limicola TaxID=2715536 RepID=UPI001409897C|nr:FKBP-type peptidyl-prolyl cis-trans isomerase [Phytoactinopolyspora limicola]